MARGFLRWSVAELAAASGVSASTIHRMEGGEGIPNSLTDNLLKLRQTFEGKGLEFISEDSTGAGAGVRPGKKS